MTPDTSQPSCRGHDSEATAGKASTCTQGHCAYRSRHRWDPDRSQHTPKRDLDLSAA